MKVPINEGVLVGVDNREADEVCRFIGLAFFRPDTWNPGGFVPVIDAIEYDWNPAKRCVLPDYIPDVVAGSPCPIQLTPWKVTALRVCAFLEIHGEISRKDIKDMGIDPRRFCNQPNQWLEAVHGKHGVFKRGPEMRFDQQHPVVYAQVLADMKR